VDGLLTQGEQLEAGVVLRARDHHLAVVRQRDLAQRLGGYFDVDQVEQVAHLLAQLVAANAHVHEAAFVEQVGLTLGLGVVGVGPEVLILVGFGLALAPRDQKFGLLLLFVPDLAQVAEAGVQNTVQVLVDLLLGVVSKPKVLASARSVDDVSGVVFVDGRPAHLLDLLLLVLLQGLHLVEVAQDLLLALLAATHGDLEVFALEVHLLIALQLQVLLQLLRLRLFLLNFIFVVQFGPFGPHCELIFCILKSVVFIFS